MVAPQEIRKANILHSLTCRNLVWTAIASVDSPQKWTRTHAHAHSDICEGVKDPERCTYVAI